MSAVVLVPRLADNGPRDRLWRFCRSRWESLGYEVVEGEDEAQKAGEPLRRGAARNAAAAAAGDWDVAIFADADIVLADILQAEKAASCATRTGLLVYPHDHLTMLEEEQTELVLGGMRPAEASVGLTRHPNTWSQSLAVPRPLWDAVGGYDERFVDWGWEDLAFMAACRTLGGGFRRIRGDAYHLWHPRSWEENEGNPHHSANHVLGQRYLDAMGNRAATLALLEERR